MTGFVSRVFANLRVSLAETRGLLCARDRMKTISASFQA